VPFLQEHGTGTVILSGWSYTDIHTNNIDLDILILRALTAGKYKVVFINKTT
jgi:hypothetical protein